MSASLQLPRGPTLTHYTSRTYFIGDAATAPEFKKLRDENTIYWKQVLDEDDGPWTQVQAMAPIREELNLPSRFSPHWKSPSTTSRKPSPQTQQHAVRSRLRATMTRQCAEVTARLHGVLCRNPRSDHLNG